MPFKNNQEGSSDMDIESKNWRGRVHVLNLYYYDTVRMNYYSQLHRWKNWTQRCKVIFPRS